MLLLGSEDIPMTIDLSNADAGQVDQFVQQLKRAKAKAVKILNFELLSAALQNELIVKMDDLTYLQEIDVGLSENINNDAIKKQFKDIAVRNKLIDLYGLDKDNLEKPWAELIQVHFKNIQESGHYRIVEDISEDRHKSKTQSDLVTALGATWHKHLFEFMQKNRDIFESQGFPYTDLMVGLISDETYYENDQIEAIRDHLKSPDSYFPFKTVTLEYNTLSEQGFSQVPALFRTFADSDMPLEKFKLKYHGTARDDHGLRLKKLIDDLLDLVKERNSQPDAKKITVQLDLGKEKLDRETAQKYIELQNLIAINVRNKNKALRQNHVQSQPREIPALITPEQMAAVDPRKIRKCKLDTSSALANVGVDIQMQQQQQQQQQQEQQQMQMQLQRKALLDQLMERRQGMGDFEAVDARSFLTLDDFRVQYENSRRLVAIFITGEPPEDVIDTLWLKLTGGLNTDFPGKIMAISKNVIDLLIAYPDAFTNGLNSHNLPPGFVLKKNKSKPEELLLDYDLTRAKLDLRNRNDLQTRFFPLNDSVMKWPGNAEQLGLTGQEFEFIKSPMSRDVSAHRMLLIEFFKRENPAFADEFIKTYETTFQSFFHDELYLIYLKWQNEGSQGVKSFMEEMAKLNPADLKVYCQDLLAKTAQENEISEYQIKMEQEYRIAVFKKMLVYEDAVIGQEINQAYDDLLKLFNSTTALQSLANIAQKEGAQGVKILFDKVDAIRKTNGIEGATHFIQYFLSRSPNNGLALMSDENLEAIAFIAELDEGQFAWWSALVTQQSKYDSNLNLLDLTKGFKEFLDQLQKLDPSLKLNAPCPISDIGNMKVALDRVLFILKNAVDPTEQFNHLQGINLEQLGAYLASRDCNYFIVTEQMDLFPEKAFINLDPEDTRERKPYQVTIHEFKGCKKSNYLDMRAQYFRLLGKQPYLEPFDKYIKLIEKLDARARRGGSSDKAGKVLGEKDVDQSGTKIAFALIAYATSHEKAMGTIDVNSVDKILNQLDGLANEPKLKRERIENALVNYIGLERVEPLTLQQIDSLIAFHIALGHEHAWNAQPDSKDHVKALGSVFFETIHAHALAMAKFKVLSAQDLSHMAQSIIENPVLSQEKNSEFRNLLFKAIAKVKGEDFTGAKVDQFIALCTDALENPEQAKKLTKLMDIVNSISVNHDNTHDLPTFDQLIKATQASLQVEEGQLFNFISTQEGFSQCYFGNRKIETFDHGSIKDFLLQNKEAIKEQLSQIPFAPVLEDEVFEDPALFMAELKKFENKIPSLLKNQLLKTVYDMLWKNHESAIILYAKSKLLPAESDPLKQQLQENELSLVVAILERLQIKDKPQEFAQLFTLQEDFSTRMEHIEKLIDALAVIKARSPKDYERLLEALNASPALSQITIPFLYETIDRLRVFHKDAFPLNVITTILNHAYVKQGGLDTLEKTENTKTWLESLIKEKSVKAADIDKIVELALTLTASEASQERIKLLNELLLKENQFRPDLFKIFQGIFKEDKFKANFGEIISNTVAFIKYCNLLPNGQELKSKLLKSYANEPQLFASMMNQLQSAPDNVKPNIITIISRCKENKIRATAGKEAEKPETITKRREQEAEQITAVIKNLEKRDNTFLEALAHFDPDVGFPNIEDILAYKEETIDNLVKLLTDRKRQAREAALEKQFDVSQVPRVLEGFLNLLTDTPLLYKQREKLQQDFYFINALGHSHTLKVDPPKGPSKIIKDMTKAEIQRLLKYYQGFVRSDKNTDEQKEKAKLIYLALLREIMYRTTGRVPFSTQILSILLSMQQHGNHISEIQTGQGKSLLSAMNAAMMHLEGQTVDVCTSNMQLARDGLAENQAFFEYVGINFTTIDSNSPLDVYCIGGINYSDVAQLALFRSRSLIEGGSQPDKVSLILDEADYTLLDDSTQYRYAINLDDVGDPLYNPFEWAYDLVNQFIESNDFENPHATAEDDIKNLRKFLIQKADGSHKDIARDAAILTDKQMDVWIDSAVAARELYKQKNVRWTLREEERFGNKISVARLILNDRISPDAQWSNGIHQFLHARINQTEEVKSGKKPRAPLDPEKAAVAATTSKNFVDFYNQKGGEVRGITGTIGSSKEKQEHWEKFGFKLTAVPPHQAQKRIDHEPILVDTDKRHQQKIFQKVLKRIRAKDKMPILIICKDATTSKALHEYIEKELAKQPKTYPLTLQLVNGIEDSKTEYGPEGKRLSDIQSEKAASDQAGIRGTITISTPMLARGTDFKPRKVDANGEEITHPQGLLVMQTYLDSERTSRQIVGRAGRQGWLGESMTIISKEALERDLTMVGQTPEKIKSKQLKAHMDRVRAYRNMTAKEQRLFSETFGDVRNHFFAKTIALIDAIPEYCENLPEEEKGGVDPKVLRKQALKQWEAFLSNLDTEWKQVLNQLDPNKPKSEQVQAALDALAQKALPIWNKMAAEFQRVGQYRIEPDQMQMIIQQAMERPFAKKAAEPVAETYKPLPMAINVHKAYCDGLAGVESLSVDSLKRAYQTEIDDVYQKLISLLSHDKTIKIKPPKQWSTLSSYNEKYQLLNELLLQINLAYHEKGKDKLFNAKYEQIEKEALAILSWLQKFDHIEEIKTDCQQMQQMLFSAYLTHRHMLSEEVPRQLFTHDQRMRDYAAAGYLYPTKGYEQHRNAGTAVLLQRSVQDSLKDFNRYKKSKGVSKTRAMALDKMIKALSQQKLTQIDILKALAEARRDAYQDDNVASIKKVLLKGVSFGNRFHNALDNLEIRLIANAQDKSTLDELRKFEMADLNSLLAQIEKRFAKNEEVTLAVNYLKSTRKYQEVLQYLPQLKDMIASDKNLHERLAQKLEHLEAIKQRTKIISLQTPEQPAKTLVEEVSVTIAPPSWRQAEIGARSAKRAQAMVSTYRQVEQSPASQPSFGLALSSQLVEPTLATPESMPPVLTPPLIPATVSSTASKTSSITMRSYLEVVQGCHTALQSVVIHGDVRSKIAHRNSLNSLDSVIKAVEAMGTKQNTTNLESLDKALTQALKDLVRVKPAQVESLQEIKAKLEAVQTDVQQKLTKTPEQRTKRDSI